MQKHIHLLKNLRDYDEKIAKEKEAMAREVASQKRLEVSVLILILRFPIYRVNIKEGPRKFNFEGFDKMCSLNNSISSGAIELTRYPGQEQRLKQNLTEMGKCSCKGFTFNKISFEGQSQKRNVPN